MSGRHDAIFSTISLENNLPMKSIVDLSIYYILIVKIPIIFHNWIIGTRYLVYTY